MAFIPWRPFADLDRFFEEGWLLPVFSRADLGQPAMDVYETAKEVVAELELPNVDPKDVTVEVKGGVLRVAGKAEEKREEKGKGYWRKEIRHGAFERAVRLPVPVKEDAVQATYEKGVLKIVLPKAAPTPPPKKVKVTIKGEK